MRLACAGMLVVISTLASGSATEAEQDRPNIIFLLTDDQRDNSFAAMGHPFVKTPNVDSLLDKSVRFSNTYVAEPTCSPSRAALLTGMHERVNGVGFTSSYKLTESQWQRTYPALVRKAGYHTGFVGKFGVEYPLYRARHAFSGRNSTWQMEIHPDVRRQDGL